MIEFERYADYLADPDGFNAFMADLEGMFAALEQRRDFNVDEVYKFLREDGAALKQIMADLKSLSSSTASMIWDIPVNRTDDLEADLEVDKERHAQLIANIDELIEFGKVGAKAKTIEQYWPRKCVEWTFFIIQRHMPAIVSDGKYGESVIRLCRQALAHVYSDKVSDMTIRKWLRAHVSSQKTLL